MKRRKFVESALTVGAVSVVAASAQAAPTKKKPAKKLPSGRLFRQIDARLDALEAGEFLSGEFVQLRIDAETGPNRLVFGPTMDCVIEVDPTAAPGLLLRDPAGIRILNPQDRGDRLLFGLTDDCTVGIEPGTDGLLLRDPFGIRIPGVAPDAASTATLAAPTLGSRILFGPTDDCSIGVAPEIATGLLIRDPDGMRILNPDRDRANRILFGPTDDCSISTDAQLRGLMIRDPGGVRVLNPDPQSPNRILFGPTDDCSISAQAERGLIFEDPNGVTVLNPVAGGANVLSFGPPVDGPDGGIQSSPCRISVVPDDGVGLIFDDPEGFLFNGNVDVDGQIIAKDVASISSGALKENVRPIERPLDVLMGLTGVRFDWKADGRPDVGFIAEDVEAVLPEVVRHDPATGGARGLTYPNMVAVAVEGIKEQQRQVRRLEHENGALRDELRELRERVDALVRGLPGPAV